nr:MAG TPA: hypothetical protein [Caudoviricetes sp.]
MTQARTVLWGCIWYGYPHTITHVEVNFND